MSTKCRIAEIFMTLTRQPSSSNSSSDPGSSLISSLPLPSPSPRSLPSAACIRALAREPRPWRLPPTCSPHYLSPPRPCYQAHIKRRRLPVKHSLLQWPLTVLLTHGDRSSETARTFSQTHPVIRDSRVHQSCPRKGGPAGASPLDLRFDSSYVLRYYAVGR